MKKILSLTFLALSTLASHAMEVPQEELNKQLIQAAADNDAEKVTQLLTAGADVNAANREGATPLHVATAWNCKKTMKLLLAHNDIDVNAADYKCRTPLHVAAHWNIQGAMKLLLAHNSINVNAEDYKDRTPLHVAASGNYRKAVKLKLLLKHADINVNAANNDNETPLHCAARHNRQKTMQLLLKHTKKKRQPRRVPSAQKRYQNLFLIITP